MFKKPITGKTSYAWGIIYPNEYTPKGNPEHDVKLSLESRKIIASRLTGKPFMFLHSTTEKDHLGYVRKAFVSKTGDLHAKFEFTHKNYHSILASSMVKNNTLTGLSLSSLIGVNRNSMDIESLDEPVEVSIVPLSKSRRGEKCTFYILDDKWICDDSKRDTYKSALIEANEFQEESEETKKPTQRDDDDDDDDDNSIIMSSEQQQQQQQQSSNTEKPTSSSSSSSTTTSTSSTGNSDDFNSKIDQILKENQDMKTQLKTFQELEFVRSEREKKQKQEEEDRTKEEFKKKLDSWLTSSIPYLTELKKSGQMSPEIETILTRCQSAMNNNNLAEMKQAETQMKLIHVNATFHTKNTERYMDLIKQNKEFKDKAKTQEEERNKLYQRLEEHNQQEKERVEMNRMNGLSSRVSLPFTRNDRRKREDSSLSSSSSMIDDDYFRDQKQQKGKENNDNDSTAQNVHFSPKLHSDTGYTHQRISTDKSVPDNQVHDFAQKPKNLPAEFLKHKPRAPPPPNGMKQQFPKLYNEIFSGYKSNHYTGIRGAYANSNFSGKKWFPEGDEIPRGNYNYKSKQAPVVPMGELE